jgi:hypothetical protein
MVNYEPWYQGGYRRIPGYERFDGRPKPSDAAFTGWDSTDVSAATIGLGYGTDTLAVTKVSGPGFQNGEGLNTGAYTINSAPTLRYAPTIDLEAEYLFNAETEYRDDIGEVPGSGPVRGAWQRLADVYAIRDNVGATAGILHKASATGWTTTGVTMAEYIRFTSGLAAGATVVEGDTLTGGISGATATIHRIVLNGSSGAGPAWDGNGEGYFVLTNVSGTFQNGEDLESPALTDIATADGVNTAFAFSTGGIYRFHNHNFFGGADTYRAYGCNGVDPAFEIDENGVCSPILMPNNPGTGTPPPNNTPYLIEEHRNHLFLGFEGGSLQHSTPGEPLVFSGFLGAGEFGLGDELTAINSIVGNVLIASTTRETRGLFGTDVSDWELRIVAEQSGSVLYGSQKIDTVYSLDDLGITSVARSDQFGDFINATVSQRIQPIVNTQRPFINDSSIVRESNQFRLYFNDNSALVMYVPAGSQSESRQGAVTAVAAQFGFLSYDIPVKQIYNTDDDTGAERTYFVTDNITLQGYVFEDQIGRNFDGEAIASYVRTAYNHLGSVAQRKKFRRADIEINAQNPLDLRFQSDLTYSSVTASTSIEDLDNVVNIPAIDIVGGGGFWDIDNWNQFLWDGQNISTARAELRGTGENIGFLIFNESATAEPFVLQGLTIHYDMRRLQR